jgi:hypothetical protein
MNKYVKENKLYYGYIYLIYDQKYKKVYIGKKEDDIEKSKNYYGSGFRIKRILKSRGKFFLKKIILGVCYTKEELIECEKECIDFFKSRNPLYGYNIAKGGAGGDTISMHPNKIENTCRKFKSTCKNTGCLRQGTLTEGGGLVQLTALYKLT